MFTLAETVQMNIARFAVPADTPCPLSENLFCNNVWYFHDSRDTCLQVQIYMLVQPSHNCHKIHPI